MTSSVNPFAIGKREFEGPSAIYVQGGDKGFCHWTSALQILFEGRRGSGKTSILDSLDWRTVWGIKGHHWIVGPEDAKKIYESPPKFLGAIFRLESMDMAYWKNWMDRHGDVTGAQKYFGTYLDLVFIDLFLSAIEQIKNLQKEHKWDSANKVFRDSVDSEKVLAEDLYLTAFPDRKSRPLLREISFSSLRSLIRDQHNHLRNLVNRMTSIEVMLHDVPVLSPASLTQCFADGLIKHYPSLSEWLVFPLLDDCNHLESWQNQVVMQAVFKTRRPLAYKLSSIQGLRTDMVTIDDKPVSEHQMKILPIMPESLRGGEFTTDYVDLINGICRAKIESHFKNGKAAQFDMRKLLGDFDLQERLKSTLLSSEKPVILTLLKDSSVRSQETKEPYSITSTWLMQKEVRKVHMPLSLNSKEEKVQRRRIDSQYLKKWNLSAGIAICKEAKQAFPYSGWRIITHLSGGSIREVLSIFAQLWSNVKKPESIFFGDKAIDWSSQRKAVLDAANSRYGCIDTAPIFAGNGSTDSSQPISVANIVDRLGVLFSRLQTYPVIILNPEIASLRVASKDLDSEVCEAIRFAIRTGAVVRMTDECGDQYTIGLQPLLAARYGNSYRNPFYYPYRVSHEDMELIFKGTTPEVDKLTKLMVSIAEKRAMDNKPK